MGHFHPFLDSEHTAVIGTCNVYSRCSADLGCAKGKTFVNIYTMDRWRADCVNDSCLQTVQP